MFKTLAYDPFAIAVMRFGVAIVMVLALPREFASEAHSGQARRSMVTPHQQS